MLKLKHFASAAVVAAWLTGFAEAQTVILAGDKAEAHAPPAIILHEHAPLACPAECCDVDGHIHGGDCDIQWLKPWKCEDLEMKEVEETHGYCGLKGFFHCPPRARGERQR